MPEAEDGSVVVPEEEAADVGSEAGLSVEEAEIGAKGWCVCVEGVVWVL